MARLFPREYPSNGEYSERQLYEAATSLDDEWVVVHSVQYFAHRDNRTTDGEADFILLHREHGGICVEVKGASTVSIDGGTWMMSDRNGTYALKKSPDRQAVDNKYELAKKIETRLGIQLYMSHVVCLPNTVVKENLGTLDRGLIWDADDILIFPAR